MAPLEIESCKFVPSVISEFISFLSITIKFYYYFACRSQLLDFNPLSASSSNFNVFYEPTKTYIYSAPSVLSA